MKVVVLIFLFLHSATFAQFADKDTALVSAAKRRIVENFNPDECKAGLAKADSVFKEGNYYLSAGIFNTSIFDTYHYLLEKKYHFKEYGTSDLLTSENCCFRNKANQIVEERFGKGFYIKVNAEADSLDKIGMGYKFAEFPEGDGMIEKYIYCRLKKDFEDFANKKHWVGFNITFTINDTGRLGHFRVFANNAEDSTFSKSVIKLLKKAPTYKPAIFNGQNVPIDYILIMHSEIMEGFTENCH